MIKSCRSWIVLGAPLLLLGLIAASARAAEVTVDDLKQRVERAAIPEQPGLCLQIAHLQLGAAGKFYSANEPEKASNALRDVALYCERASNAAIESRSHEKQTEIGVRKMIHRLTDMRRAAVQEDQGAIKAATDRLERVRDSLLAAMFPKHPHQ